MATIGFILGPPGVGKTTLAREMIGPSALIGRWSVGASCAALGAYTGDVKDGADSQPFTRDVFISAFSKAEATVGSLPLLVDGVRTQSWMFDYWKGARRLAGILLAADLLTIRRRRIARGSAHMGDSWYIGQRRIAERLAEQIQSSGGRVVVVDAERPVSEQRRKAFSVL